MDVHTRTLANILLLLALSQEGATEPNIEDRHGKEQTRYTHTFRPPVTA